jgi:hypothetical protein
MGFCYGRRRKPFTVTSRERHFAPACRKISQTGADAYWESLDIVVRAPAAVDGFVILHRTMKAVLICRFLVHARYCDAR